MNNPSPRSSLPRSVAVRKLAAQSQSLCGVIDGAGLPRLSEAVSAISGPVTVELRFDPGTAGFPEVAGRVSAQVAMVCQRCLDTLTVALEVPIAVGVVQDIAAEQRLPRRLDPWIVTDEEGDLFDLAEEELLLALPIVALHEDESCHASPAVTGDAGDTRNPFRVLAELKLQR
ncbi:MAG: YceD family protein [Porticoccaceae bacterium]